MKTSPNFVVVRNVGWGIPVWYLRLKIFGLGHSSRNHKWLGSSVWNHWLGICLERSPRSRGSSESLGRSKGNHGKIMKAFCCVGQFAW